MIDGNFLVVKFTEVTLLHILILLGLPYIILYFFERFTKFDKFPEKWELALFIFVVGGSITSLSLLLQEIKGINFMYGYIIFSLIFCLFLIIYTLIKRIYLKTHNKKTNNIGWIKVKLKNGELYTGVYINHDNLRLQISCGREDKIQKEINNKKIDVKAKIITFNCKEISAILYY